MYIYIYNSGGWTSGKFPVDPGVHHSRACGRFAD